ncbi:four helix bundle protein [Candidatus Sumerlaeota bacterium]|nr:four helix bundle protein [Candidatus Sumerlaeota bacterium]
MGAFKRFEDIECWREARALVVAVYKITNLSGFSKDFALRDQIRRAVLSIMCNIAEGFERGRKKEFVRFLSIAKGSAGEVRSQLYAAADLGYIDAETFQSLSDAAAKISRMISALIDYLEKDMIKTRE